MAANHIPVLLEETLALLQPAPGRRYLDATFGRGGHSRRLLESGARVVALDRDPDAVAAADVWVKNFGSEQFEIRKMNFSDIDEMAKQGERFDGVLFDFGVSSPQLDDAERGFSFQQDGPLDMRMDPATPLTAQEIVNHWSEEDLARLIFEYGEDRAARRIAAAIGRARREAPLKSTLELAGVVERALGGRRDRKIHPATKTFQAIRIRVNEELKAIDHALAAVPDLLVSGGRLAAISFHALEDRRVKRFIEEGSREEIRGERYAFGHPNPDRVFKKLGRWLPGEAELADNPRARSARLRGAERI